MTGTGTPLLEADFRVHRGEFDLELALAAEPGEVLALVGPNGAGKSTTLRVLAGLLTPERGSIKIGGRVLVGDGISLPVYRRPVGVVFQDYLLFPHLTVLDNVAFGLRAAGMSRSASRKRAAEWLDRLDAGDLAGQRPQQLSGGQAQRVALARSLATEPQLLLLDEPLAALDARTRLLVRSELRRHLERFDGATIVITHDPTDAAVLADRLVVIENGRLVQTGTPQQVARRPRTDYVARLVGLNLLSGIGVDDPVGDYAGVDQAGVDQAGIDHGVRLLDGTVIAVPGRASGRVLVAFRPSAVALWRSRPAGSPRNVWPVEVRGLEPYGDSVRVELAHSGGAATAGPAVLAFVAEITAAAVADLRLGIGDRLWATLKASEIDVYPA